MTAGEAKPFRQTSQWVVKSEVARTVRVIHPMVTIRGQQDGPSLSSSACNWPLFHFLLTHRRGQEQRGENISGIHGVRSFAASVTCHHPLNNATMQGLVGNSCEAMVRMGQGHGKLHLQVSDSPISAIREHLPDSRSRQAPCDTDSRKCETRASEGSAPFRL
ncbi:hypothetical protein TREES_T100011712 [Tupaia chinensis]|uniref:Uncharacterized protein n=1 Tax=Tupaia chinensis TaxID=246437 RepID=L9L1Y0_TUPCH|nr:hypothetical protein TREES_T100011712 [Tupaia chinensis]